MYRLRHSSPPQILQVAGLIGGANTLSPSSFSLSAAAPSYQISSSSSSFRTTLAGTALHEPRRDVRLEASPEVGHDERGADERGEQQGDGQRRERGQATARRAVVVLACGRGGVDAHELEGEVGEAGEVDALSRGVFF